MPELHLPDPGIFHILHGNGHPAMGLVLWIQPVIVRDQSQIFDAGIPDASRPVIDDQFPASVSGIKRIRQGNIEGQGIPFYVLQGPVPHEFPLAGFPPEVFRLSPEISHIQPAYPFRCRGSPYHNPVAFAEVGLSLDMNHRAARRHISVGNFKGHPGLPVILPADTQQGHPFLACRFKHRTVLSHPAAPDHDA